LTLSSLGKRLADTCAAPAGVGATIRPCIKKSSAVNDLVFANCKLIGHNRRGHPLLRGQIERAFCYWVGGIPLNTSFCIPAVVSAR